MALQKLTDKQSLTSYQDNDIIHVVDVSDTSSSPQGTSKKSAISLLRSYFRMLYDSLYGSATDVAANNTKVTNATHTGEVIGSQSLSLTALAISNKDLKSSLSGSEEIVINDAGEIAKTTCQDVADLAASGGASVIFKKDFRFSGFSGRYYRSRGASDGGIADSFNGVSPTNLLTIFNLSNPLSGWTIFKNNVVKTININYSTIHAETYILYLVVKRFSGGVETNDLLYTSPNIVTSALSTGSLSITGLNINLLKDDRLFVSTLRIASTESVVTGIALSIELNP